MQRMISLAWASVTVSVREDWAINAGPRSAHGYPQGDLFHVLAWGFAPLYAGLLGVYRVRARLWKVFASQCNEAEACKTHDVDVLRPTKSCNANHLAVQIGKYVASSLQST